jgi:hypothetical protein
MSGKKWVEPELREVADVPAAWGSCESGSTPVPGPPCEMGGMDMPMGCINGDFDAVMCSPGNGYGPF